MPSRGGYAVVVLLLAGALLAGCGSSRHLREYKVPSSGMQPTLRLGQHVNADLDAYRKHSPSVGDIVALHPPRSVDSIGACGDPQAGQGTARPCDLPAPGLSSSVFLKRIVAGPGDSIALAAGRVIRNGAAVPEPYITSCTTADQCDFPKPITLPADHWFVLGDNRGQSDDSRFWGPIPTNALIGKVLSGG
jgi:signal peptidase I